MGKRAKVIKARGTVKYARIKTPLGDMFAASVDGVLTDIALSSTLDSFLERLEEKHGPELAPAEDARAFADLRKRLDEYFKGCPVDFALSLEPAGTPFQKRVWKVIEKIPRGSTMSYLEVAAAVGSPGASRAVGGACGANPLPIVIPCHRVLASSGGIGGYTGGVGIKKMLLELEGVRTR